MRQLREVEPELPADGGGRGQAVIVDYGERDLVRASGKPVRRRSLGPSARRYLVLVMACVLTGSAVWAWTQPRSTAAATAAARQAGLAAVSSPSTVSSPSAAATLAATGTLAPVTLPLAPSPSPSPRSALAGVYISGGWFKRVDVPVRGVPEIGPVGPDGTIYVAGAAALDRDGNERTTYQTPNGSVPLVFDADGTAYGVDYGQETASIWAMRPDGNLVFTYTVAVQVHVDLFWGGSWLYAIYPVNVAGVDAVQVLRIGLSGEALPGWQLSGLVASNGGQLQFVVRPNGNLLVQVVRSGDCSVDVFTPTGVLLQRTSGCWQYLAQSDDGTLVAWTCSSVAAGACSETAIAVLDDNGTVTKGWPKLYDAAAAIPAVGPQGLFTVLMPGTTSATVIGLSRAGAPLKGWPVGLDQDPEMKESATCGCLLPPSVVVGRATGTVLLATDNDLAAWNRSGQSITIWGMTGAMGSPLASPMLSESGGGLVLFSAHVDRIEGFSPDASKQATPMFVDQGADKVGWLGWQRMPDGGVVSFWYHAGNTEAYVIVARLTVSP